MAQVRTAKMCASFVDVLLGHFDGQGTEAEPIRKWALVHQVRDERRIGVVLERGVGGFHFGEADSRLGRVGDVGRQGCGKLLGSAVDSSQQGLRKNTKLLEIVFTA